MTSTREIVWDKHIERDSRPSMFKKALNRISVTSPTPPPWDDVVRVFGEKAREFEGRNSFFGTTMVNRHRREDVRLTWRQKGAAASSILLDMFYKPSRLTIPENPVVPTASSEFSSSFGFQIFVHNGITQADTKRKSVLDNNIGRSLHSKIELNIKFNFTPSARGSVSVKLDGGHITVTDPAKQLERMTEVAVRVAQSLRPLRGVITDPAPFHHDDDSSRSLATKAEIHSQFVYRIQNWPYVWSFKVHSFGFWNSTTDRSRGDGLMWQCGSAVVQVES
ncbi:hypothetical protein CPB83DRAFT_839043 [Crepidotus variabilis]|uniref:Uncharacterized protein n=1 Tax=Crepidotus variabilis TaxID=179855 RepID=A0A9P6E8N9_9AGAR|nr:hypothetical protein CPB83DRAFT_839043 [Crepidotus variabilis]